jgi:hypothetical protein
VAVIVPNCSCTSKVAAVGRGREVSTIGASRLWPFIVTRSTDLRPPADSDVPPKVRGHRERAPTSDVRPLRHGDAPIDLHDANDLFSSARFDHFSVFPPRRHHGVAWALLRFAKRWLDAARQRRSSAEWRSPGCSVLFVVHSENQFQAVEPVARRLEGSVVMGDGAPGDTPFPRWRAFPRALLPVHLRQLYDTYASSDPRGRRAIRLRLDDYVLTQGYLSVAREILEASRPRLVVLANDHNMQSRTFLHAARHAGIRTVYLQHASVTERFPPLAFDLSFLDGLDSAHKYARAGSPVVGDVFLTGIAKADPVRRLAAERRGGVRKVGICVNLLDDTNDVVSAVTTLRELRPELEFTLRPHPRDRRKWERHVDLAVSRGETSFEFLTEVDAIVSGPSNIILEAGLAGIAPIFLDFSGRGGDNYGFVAAGLCPRATSAVEAASWLSPSSVAALRERTMTALPRYCASAGTRFDGRVGEAIAGLIRQELAGGIDLTAWRRLDDPAGLRPYVWREANQPGLAVTAPDP